MEKPNLLFIENLSKGNLEFKKELITIIITEFAKEKKDYLKAIKAKDFEKTIEYVHKLKHKISILGLKKDYEIADNFEIALKEKDNLLQEEFKIILTKVTNFLEKI